MTPDLRTVRQAVDEVRSEKPVPEQAPAAEPHPVDQLDRLRTILVGRERDSIRRIEDRLNNPDALSPVVTRALTASVRRDPRPLADALFPVMGPAIRRAISQTLAGMMQSLNQALEHTFSLQGLAWRWEAIRTGTSFAEVVLRHSLVYRVEQVFLVHRESGLLLQHLTAPSVAAQPPDMVAGMLTAIQDFARDSFQMAQEEMLEKMQVGELTIWVEQGARSLLASVIRGHAPVEFRTDMQRTLEAIEAEHAAELGAFQGDASVFGRSRPALELLLLMESKAATRTGVPWRTWVLLGLLGVLLLVLAIPAITLERKWRGYLRTLRATSGVVVTQAGRDQGHYLVQGLRDPLAADPAALRDAAGLEAGQVTERWEPYVALMPEFIARRAAHSLSAPATISLGMAGDTLVARGAAPESWFQRAALLAPALAGVGAWRAERILPRELPALAPYVAQVEQYRLLFQTGQAEPDSAGTAMLGGLAGDIANLDSASRALGFSLRVTLVGSADDQGNEDLNTVLRRDRAEVVRLRLSPLVPPSVTLISEPAPTDTTSPASAEERALRRAVFPRADLGE